jgi:hypothetical protein
MLGWRKEVKGERKTTEDTEAERMAIETETRVTPRERETRGQIIDTRENKEEEEGGKRSRACVRERQGRREKEHQNREENRTGAIPTLVN